MDGGRPKSSARILRTGSNILYQLTGSLDVHIGTLYSMTLMGPLLMQPVICTNGITLLAKYRDAH